MKQNHLRSLEIIGYSGGGSIAALISDKRNDVLRFVTVAANLDIDEWAKYLNVSPLWGSMNPVINSLRSRFIQQVHLSGSNDTIVPTAVLKNYLIKTEITNPRSLILLDGYTHSCCWHKGWKDMIIKIRSKILSEMQNNVSGFVIDNGSTRGTNLGEK